MGATTKSQGDYYSIEELERELKYARDLKAKWSHFIGNKVEVPAKMITMVADDLIKMTTELLMWKGKKLVDIFKDEADDITDELEGML